MPKKVKRMSRASDERILRMLAGRRVGYTMKEIAHNEGLSDVSRCSAIIAGVREADILYSEPLETREVVEAEYRQGKGIL